MKVNKWKGNESNCAREYINGTGKSEDTRDVFQSFNSSIRSVISQCYGTIADAYSRVISTNDKIKGANDEMDRVNKDLTAARSEIQVAGQSKEQKLAQLIEIKKREYVDNATIYPQSEFDRLDKEAQEAKAMSVNPQPPVTKEEIRQSLLESKGAAGAVSNAAKSVLDAYNMLYTEFGKSSCDGYWSVEFADHYEKVSSRIMNDADIMMGVQGEDYTKEKVLEKFNNSFKKSPYDIIKIILMLFLFPVAIVKYKYNEKSIPKCISIIIKDIQYNNDRMKRIFSIIAWLVELKLLIFNKLPLTIASVIVLVSLIACFFFAKKKLVEQIDDMIAIDVCYKHMVGSIDQQVDDQYYAGIEKARAAALTKYNELCKEIDKMSRENDEARSKALREFDASKIDKSTLESEYVTLVSKMKERVISLENKLAELKKQKEQIEKDRQPLIQAYTESKDKVRSLLSADDERNGFTVEGKQFCFAFAQIDALEILKRSEPTNSLNMIMSLTGRSITSIEDSAEAASDMPPISIPIDIVPVTKDEIKDICSERNWYEQVYTDLQEIMVGVDSSVKKDLAGIGIDTSRLDFTKFYRFITVKHGLRCSVVFYNSADDKDSVRTITNLCIHNIIHPTVCTTDKRGLSFRIFAKDRTAFDTVNYSIGASMEQANSMAANHFYEVYDNSEKEKIVTELYTSGLATSKEIGNQASNIVEYRARKMNGGSYPTRITYALFVDDVERFWSDNLRMLLNGTGGTQSGGHDTVGDNKYGVVPILFLDLADLMCERPDTSKINKYEEIANAIAFDNFFYISSKTDSLKKYDRKTVQDIINAARQKSR